MAQKHLWNQGKRIQQSSTIRNSIVYGVWWTTTFHSQSQERERERERERFQCSNCPLFQFTQLALPYPETYAVVKSTNHKDASSAKALPPVKAWEKPRGGLNCSISQFQIGLLWYHYFLFASTWKISQLKRNIITANCCVWRAVHFFSPPYAIDYKS